MLPYILCLLASIFYGYQYILRVLPNIILDDIIKNFNINEVIFGQFSGVYYLGYVIMHLPLGIMLDRYGPRKVISLSIMLCSISLLPIIFASNYIYLIISRIILGIGSSTAILGVFKIIRLNFDEKYFTKMLSISVTIGLFGAVYGGGPLSYLCEILGYQSVVKLLALAGFILSLVTFLLIPQIESTITQNILSNLKSVFINRRVLLLSCFAGLMVGPLEGFADVWGAKYLKQLYHLDNTTSSYISSMIFVGMCFGAPILSFIAEKTGQYINTIIGAGIIMLIIFLLLIAQVLSIKLIIASFITVGVCSSYQILAIYQSSTYTNPKLTAITTAVANMIIMSFGYGFHALIGLIVDNYKNVNPSLALNYGISIIPCALILSIIGLLAMQYYKYLAKFISKNSG